MNLLDRYLFKSVFYACAAAVGVLGFVFLIVNVARDLMPYLSIGLLSPDLFAKLILLLVPYVPYYTLPMGILTGVLLTLGRLSADSEITAMRTAGLSMARIARPILVFGFLSFLLGLYINFEAMPWSRVQYHKQLDEAVQTKPLSLIVPKTFIRDFKGLVIYLGSREGKDLRDVWVWQLDEKQRTTALWRAQSGTIEFIAAENAFSITLQQAQVTNTNHVAPELYNEKFFIPVGSQVQNIKLPLDDFFGRNGGRRQKLDWMTYDELNRERERLAHKQVPAKDQPQLEQDRMKLEFAVQQKYTLAVAAFTFALFAIPLGIKVGRRETSANLGIAVAMALGYYLLTTLVGMLDRRPELRPDLLLWIPNLVFLGLGFWLFSRIGKK